MADGADDEEEHAAVAEVAELSRAGDMTSRLDGDAARAKAELLLLDVLLGDASSEPYESYRWVREHAPVLRTRTGPLAVSRYRDADTALRHRDLGKPTEGFGGGQGHLAAEQVRQAMSRWQRSMIFSNPPD